MAQAKGVNTVSDMKNWTSRCETENKAAASWTYRWGCVFDPNAKAGELGLSESVEDKARCVRERQKNRTARPPVGWPLALLAARQHAAIAAAPSKKAPAQRPAAMARAFSRPAVPRHQLCALLCFACR